MYVAFANGRLEQFIEGARTLEAANMRHPSTSALIAQTMARLHSLPLPSSATPQPACWSLIESWLNGEKDSLLLEQGSTEPALQLQRLQTVQDALKLAHELLPLLRDDPTVLCHNDLLCGNILQEIGGDRLYLIDYECSPPCCPALAPFTLLLQVRRRQLCRIRHGKCTVCKLRPAMGQTEYVRDTHFRDHVVCVPLCSAYLCDVCDIERWVQRHGFW